MFTADARHLAPHDEQWSVVSMNRARALDILGLSVQGQHQGLDPDTVKKAYHERARAVHPDKNPGDEEASEKFKEAQEAYTFLCANPDPVPTNPTISVGGFSFSPFQSKPETRVRLEVQDICNGKVGGVPTNFMQPQLERVVGIMGGCVCTCLCIFGHPPCQVLYTTDGCKVDIPPGAAHGMAFDTVEETVVLEEDPADLAPYQRVGPDVVLEVKVPLWQALTGGSIRLPPCGDGTCMPDLPHALTLAGPLDPGSVYELTNVGFPRLGDHSHRGSLLITVQVIMPKTLGLDMALQVAPMLGATDYDLDTHFDPTAPDGLPVDMEQARARAAAHAAAVGSTCDAGDNPLAALLKMGLGLGLGFGGGGGGVAGGGGGGGGSGPAGEGGPTPPGCVIA
jgi:hypothetical protein